MWTEICQMNQKTSPRKTHLPYTGWNLCPEVHCAKGQWETRKISVSSLDMLVLGSAWGKSLCQSCTNEPWRDKALHTHPAAAGSPPSQAHPHPTAPQPGSGIGADWAKRAPSRASCYYYTALPPTETLCCCGSSLELSRILYWESFPSLPSIFFHRSRRSPQKGFPQSLSSP